MTPTIFSLLFLLCAGIVACLAYQLGLRRPLAAVSRGERFHSTPDYYGWYAVIVAFAPPLLVSIAVLLLRIISGTTVPRTAVLVSWLVLPLLALGPILWTIRPNLRARAIVERVVYSALFAASAVSILTTVGIVLAILFESLRFFEQVSLWNFLTGTTWSPDTAFLGGAGRGEEDLAKPQFGAVPLFAGTFLITGIAMLVAVPIGVYSAVYMSEYAASPVRRIAKPLLEILAGIPTVVYGFFAAITVSPAIVRLAELFGLEADYTNALSPGLIMGVMIIPFMSSLSDDVIRAVPQDLRRGAFALGATRAEVIKQVVLPAAFPGIASAFLLSVSRAVGETMIVVMAAGLRPNLTLNPLQGMTTVTVRIVDALVGDQEFDSLETLSAFGLGMALLVLTLIFNIASAIVIRKFRQRYE